MAFFNYSTMQMTAKIVYYGPGLCGKTTNLQYIYGHTADNSHGEMVSLETQTDRTLFFDLLPMEVGTVAGFKTRIQLYTVPGQVFYNTTRKLVLKGVDGIVFVADSQTPMAYANVESLNNLEENLAELGVSLETLPLVLQYNKRDLPDIRSIEELDRSLNRGDWSTFEASAVTGDGVFETLRGISRLTLISLRNQLETGTAQRATPSRSSQGPERVSPRTEEKKRPASSRSSTDRLPAESADARPSPDVRTHRRDYLLRLPRKELKGVRKVALTFQLENDRGTVIRESRRVRVEVSDSRSAEEMLIQLNLALRPTDENPEGGDQ
jgi:signal recognition particle receptor subunit beta